MRMRPFILFGAAAILPVAARAAVVTLGSTRAASCYHAAEARAPTMQAMRACNAALSDEALSRRDEVATYVNRGALFLVSGQLANATRDFDRALALDPNQAEAWLNKARVAMELGDSRTAGRLADKALALGTRTPALAHYLRAAAREDSGEIGGAYADLVRARALAPRWELPAKELARFQVSRR